MQHARVRLTRIEIRPLFTVSAFWNRVRSSIPVVAALIAVAVVLAFIWTPALQIGAAASALTLTALMALAHLFPLQVADKSGSHSIPA